MKTIWITISLIITGSVWYFLGFPGLPTPTTETVAVTSVPASAIVGESFSITWQVDNPQSITIPHTAIHYGPESKVDISYPEFTDEFAQGSFTIPNTFTAVVRAPDNPGTLYFRAHALIEEMDVWTEEDTIEIQPAPLGSTPSETVGDQELEQPTEQAVPPVTSIPETEMPPINLEQEVAPVPEPELPSPSPLSSTQEFSLEQSVYPGSFTPDPLIVKRGIPVKLLVTTLHREHVNRISILPWVTTSDTLVPGKVTIIEFTPDQTGDFNIRNIVHGFEGVLRVTN